MEFLLLLPHTTLVTSMLHLLHTHISCFKIQNPKISPYVSPYSGTPKHKLFCHNYFASTLIGLSPALYCVLTFGSDRDKALTEAFTHNFPYAVQLGCFIHFRRNIEEKVKSLGFSSTVAQEFLSDIFCNQIGNAYQEGLVDSFSHDDFDRRLSEIKSIWNARESAISSREDSSSFYDSFSKDQSEIVKYHMSKYLRESVGLRSPPSTFTTNGSESINAAIKLKVNHKESEWP